jgi:hypothetical protein
MKNGRVERTFTGRRRGGKTIASNPQFGVERGPSDLAAGLPASQP